jgi:hypothetical protein
LVARALRIGIGLMPAPFRRQLYITLAILGVGWGIGIPIYLRGASDEELPYELTDAAKLNVSRLERLGGKSAVFYQQLGDSLASLFQGWRLGITIAVVSCVVALVYFIVSTRKP